MSRVPFAFAALSFSLAIAQAPQPYEIHINAKGPTHPFPHFWETAFGSGRAILSLRDSYRRDLRTMTRFTGIRQVRFHGILNDEVGIYNSGSYNFSYVDQIYDGLLENGVRPFVELSFMPGQLSSSETTHAFWYKPYPNPPNDYAKWDDLIHSFASHLIDRYGIGEVSQWWFEVWNEPNIDFWTGNPKQSTYFTLYDHTAHALKSANQRLRLGGPATAQAAWIAPMIAHCVQDNVPLDFVSTHVYGNDSAKDVFGVDENVGRSDMVARAVRKVYDEVKRSQRPQLPIIWSEYNASYLNEIEITDSPFMGPWLANNIRLCDGLTTAMSYWTFSDVFEEQGVIKTPFYGGYGLIAEGNVPKAAFNAFRLLHRLGTERIETTDPGVLATRRADGSVAVAVWGHPQIRVIVDGMRHIEAEIVDENHGNALAAWTAMGRSTWPSAKQYEKLRQAAKATLHVTGPTFSLSLNGLALVEATTR
jgi:xylan 1,4-beta-xylosidase